MKTSIKILWGGLILIVLTGLIFITLTRLDLHEVVPEYGNGILIEKTIPMENFVGFTAHDRLIVHYQAADQYAIKVRTDSNMHKHLRFDVSNGDWAHIATDESFGNASLIEVTVYAPHIIGFNADNSAEVICDSAFEQASLEVRTQNSGKARFFANTKELILRAHGSSTIYAQGQTEDLSVVVYNSSEIDASELRSQYAEVMANSNGMAKLSVEKRLVANTGEGAQVLYSGPESLIVKSEGNGISKAIR
ncbi:MAG: DUF2807 domain-containing protein [Bacteroidia bacterium]